jgi:hypothetical protein
VQALVALVALVIVPLVGASIFMRWLQRVAPTWWSIFASLTVMAIFLLIAYIDLIFVANVGLLKE